MRKGKYHYERAEDFRRHPFRFYSPKPLLITGSPNSKIAGFLHKIKMPYSQILDVIFFENVTARQRGEFSNFILFKKWVFACIQQYWEARKISFVYSECKIGNVCKFPIDNKPINVVLISFIRFPAKISLLYKRFRTNTQKIRAMRCNFHVSTAALFANALRMGNWKKSIQL